MPVIHVYTFKGKTTKQKRKIVAGITQAMVDGAVRMGIQRDNALKLVARTVEGTVALLNDGISTSRLREMVTSPGGTTADGLFVMEREGFKGMVIEAVEAASERASEIADQTSEVDG